MNLLILAARNKFRFPSNKGALTFEQLWDLALQSKTGFSLDNVAQQLDAEIQAAGRTSFVDKGGNPAKSALQAKLDLVIEVINAKQAENAAVVLGARRRAEKDQLLEILHDKKKSELLGLSAAEIEARIKALEG